MKVALAYARTETLQYVRFPAYAIPTLVFPGLFMLLLGRQLERGEPARLLVGFAAMAVLTVTFFQFGVGIATSRTTPWEAYLRTLPAGPATRLAGRILSALGFAAATVAVVAVVGIAVHQTTMPTWRYGASLIVLLAGSIPFALLGIALGYWLPPRAALPVANLTFLPLAIVGALWARPQGLPHTADVVSQLAPTRSWMEILDSVATGDHRVPLHHIAALALWTGAFGALAVWGYHRDEGERFR